MAILLSNFAWAYAPVPNQAKVNVKWPDAAREVLVIEGLTYRAELDVANAGLEVFNLAGESLLNIAPGTLFLDNVAVSGPGRINIYSFGPEMYEIHLRDLKAMEMDGEVELALYCYGERIFFNLNVRRYDDGPAPAPRINISMSEANRQPESGASSHVVYVPNIALSEEGASRRGSALGILLATGSEQAEQMLHQELHANRVMFELHRGNLEGYKPERGFYEITVDYTGPRSFEEGLINPNQRYEVGMEITSPFPANIVCNVRHYYGVLEAAVLTDEHGFPLPVQVQVCKNFGGEFEEGRKEGDTSYGESYVPVALEPDTPFKGKVYHLFANWGTHPLIQISSIRFFHHYFHASIGPTETFCYVPFEYPREDGRNYYWADVRGQSNFFWPDQPQHHHVSVLGHLRYKSGGAWVNNLHQDTRIYLTSPNLASFGNDYLSEDGKIATTLEVFETPELDETRSYVELTLNVLDTVEIDGDSAHNLRFLNAGAYIVRTVWPHVSYTDANGETQTVDVPADDSWALEAVPLGKDTPFAAAYSHENGNMAFVIQSFEGVLGGKPVDQFGLSVYGDTRWTEMFLTAPESIDRLEKGDWIKARYFVMPYGHAAVNHAPAERQRYLYGEKPVTMNVTAGTAVEGYPHRVRINDQGYARFTIKDGNDWTPILVEGFDTHKAPMLWQRRGAWLFHDQQIHGNDWYQSYVAEDGTYGFVFLVWLRPDMTHDYLVTLAPNAESITQENGYVTIEGGPMDFVSPVRFAGLTCTPIEGTGLYHCVGDVNSATAIE